MWSMKSIDSLTRLSATNVLIAMNLVTLILLACKNPSFLLIPGSQVLIDLGANFGLLTCSGQWWRIVTSMFLHVGALHFLINMYALTKVGPPAEALFGWREFLLIYFFSGIMGSLASLLWNPMLISAGASGAIFGVYGSLLAFMFVQRDEYPPATLRYHALMAAGLLVCNAAYGLMVPEIDNFAHIGGLLSGAFAGFLLAHVEVAQKYRAAFSIPVMALLIAALGWISFTSFGERGFSDYHQGLEALKGRNYALAVEDITRFIFRNPKEADAYGSRGFAYSKEGELELALSDFNKVTTLAPNSGEAFNSKGWVEDGLAMYDKAIEDATIAIKLNPRAAAYYDTRGYAYASIGQSDKALEDYAKAAKLDPKDTASRYHRLQLLQKLGRPAENAGDKEIASQYHPESWEH